MTTCCPICGKNLERQVRDFGGKPVWKCPVEAPYILRSHYIMLEGSGDFSEMGRLLLSRMGGEITVKDGEQVLHKSFRKLPDSDIKPWLEKWNKALVMK